jgi:phosphate transport system protein
VQHTSRAYESEVQQLRAAAAKMGERCRDALRLSVEAFLTASHETAAHERAKRVAEVKRLDQRVDEDEKEIDALALQILALRQPVASDLRLLMTALKLVTDLERIGDEAVNIAERAEQGPCGARGNAYDDLKRMSELTQGMVSAALQAFVEGNQERARQVILQDDEVDELYGGTLRAVEDYMKAHPVEISSALCVISVAKYLERVADHATNIAEEVIFMVRGEDVRHLGSLSIVDPRRKMSPR